MVSGPPGPSIYKSLLRATASTSLYSSHSSLHLSGGSCISQEKEYSGCYQGVNDVELYMVSFAEKISFWIMGKANGMWWNSELVELTQCVEEIEALEVYLLFMRYEFMENDKTRRLKSYRVIELLFSCKERFGIWGTIIRIRTQTLTVASHHH